MLLLVFIVCLPAMCCATEDGPTCYTSGGVAGIVIATVVVTLVMGGLAAATIWYLWKQRSAFSDEEKKKPGSTFFRSVGEKNCLEQTEQKKHPPEAGKEAYAFDNPFFKDDEMDAKKKKKDQDAAEKGESGFRVDNGDVKHSPSTKLSVGAKLKKSRPFSNLQLPNVFHQGFKKPRAMDDTFLSKPLERVQVPLRGHDFTGLGFNICGNMRDGIFVKDVLHRGPASESGKIKAGDRIVGVWVSFGSMVYEDALTILSYASPYDVKLELEKTVDAKRNVPASSPGSKTRLFSSSFRTGQRLFHPLYRSQSFDDLTQIGKETQSNNNNGANTAVQNLCSSCPKRSQSIEPSTSPKPKIQKQENAPKDGSSHSNIENGSILTKPSITHEIKVKKTSADVKPRRTQEVSMQQKSNSAECSSTGAPPIIVTSTPIKSARDLDESEERPTAPPRKVIHIKRKAPSPPTEDQDPSSKTETSAIVHREAGQDVTDSPSVQSSSALEDSSTDTKAEKSATKCDAVCSDSSAPLGQAVQDAASSPKRKASSLGDLTTLDSSGQKKIPPVSTILERAVSLDLQQTLPEENLVKQKMILKRPPFDTTEEEFNLLTSNEKNTKITKWESSWSDEVPDAEIETMKLPNDVIETTTANITNGHAESHISTDDEFAFDLPNETDELKNSINITSTPVRKVIEADCFFKDTIDIDDIPYLGDQKSKDEDTIDKDINAKTIEIVSPPPIPLTIPIIKPIFSQFEKLSNKIPNLDQSVEMPSNVELQRQDILNQDISSKESAYKPVFSSNSFRGTSIENTSDDSILSAMDIVNGNGLDTSSSFAQYRTASDDSSASDVQQTQITKEVKMLSIPEITGIKVHGGAAGFAKTLIMSTPIESESIALTADSPPPKLEPPM